MIRFRMAKISVKQFAILTDTVPTDGLSYIVGMQFKTATEFRRVGCEFSVEFAHDDKAILKLTIFCEFDIQPDDWAEHIIENALLITKEDLGYFANQTVGVARGIMFCKTESTPFCQFIVPPINLTELIKEDLKVEI